MASTGKARTACVLERLQSYDIIIIGTAYSQTNNQTYDRRKTQTNKNTPLTNFLFIQL